MSRGARHLTPHSAPPNSPNTSLKPMDHESWYYDGIGDMQTSTSWLRGSKPTAPQGSPFSNSRHTSCALTSHES
eukprot:10472265-Karenia_brevis.AAC.1